MEYEFTNGSRFIRLQRNNETKQLPLIKIPKKLGKYSIKKKNTFIFFSCKFFDCEPFYGYLFTDREATSFVLIAQFCNFINEHHAKHVSDMDASNNTSIQANVVVLLTSEKLADSKCSNISCTGILDAIGIHYETIREFYAKFKNKWALVHTMEAFRSGFWWNTKRCIQITKTKHWGWVRDSTGNPFIELKPATNFYICVRTIFSPAESTNKHSNLSTTWIRIISSIGKLNCRIFWWTKWNFKSKRTKMFIGWSMWMIDHIMLSGWIRIEHWSG